MECPVTRTRPSMKISLLALATVFVTGLVAAPALAEDEEASRGEAGSLYIEYLAGLSHHPNGTIRGINSSSVGLFGRAEPKVVGYFIGGSLGGYVIDNVRAEIQVGYRNSGVDQIQVQGESASAGGSQMSLLSVTYNAYYDFDLKELADSDVPVTPWLGLGIGWGMPRIDAENNPGLTQLSIDDTDSTMVYNFMGGVNVPIGDTAELVLGYRYLASIEFDVRGSVGGATQRFEYEYGAHEAFTGVRFDF